MSKRQCTTVLFIWKVDERLQRYFSDALKHETVELLFPSCISQEDLAELAPKADIMVGWRPTRDLLSAAKKSRLFINPGAGVQHLIELFREITRSQRVQLANCHGNSYFVAQHAVALLFALTNKTIPHHNWMVSGEWRKRDEDAKSEPLRDRKVGLLGYGSINQKVHQFLSGFDLEFSILRRDWSKQSNEMPTAAKRYIISELDLFLNVIDTLVVAVPLTPATEGLIGMKELELLGSKGLLVNVGRGAVIDEESLFVALKNEVIAGAAIDVWYDYDPDPDADGRKYPYSHPFHTLGNVVLSPHRVASPFNDLRRWDEVIENIRRFANAETQFINIISLENEY